MEKCLKSLKFLLKVKFTLVSFTKGNVVTVIVMTLIVILVAFYSWTVLHKSKLMALQDSPAGHSFGIDEEASPYTDLKGNPVALSDYVGEILVVSSWASWCPFCGGGLTRLSNLAEAYPEEEVRILAINRAESATTAERFLKSVGATNGIMLILDADDRYYKSIGGFTMPETLFYDRTGNIIHHHRGEMSLIEMRQYVDETMLVTKEVTNQ
jgi:thiol-disulfide isomerase/thioredoxin